ncbi:Unknown protein [Striga hermonthica]|uniref:Uncharacterized protein n=1 Tax=Striga hermonthica TaxID=68872 RepID=A0A9N7N175_STRHE|nr:Unknown protein [Striga hermonthica]
MATLYLPHIPHQNYHIVPTGNLPPPAKRSLYKADFPAINSSAVLTEIKRPPELGKLFARMMGFCICPLDTPARLLWCSSFFRHKLMLF